MRPIPKNLLVHDVIYMEKAEGRYEGGFKEPVLLKNVLVKYKNALIKNSQGEEKTLKGKLYIDCINSIPKNIEILKKSKIIHDDNEFTVEAVELVIGFKALHHLEVDLV